MKLAFQGDCFRLAMPIDSLRPLDGDSNLVFKFICNGNWVPLRGDEPNSQPDGKGNTNLRIDRNRSGYWTFRIYTAAPLRLDENYTLVMDGIADRRVRFQVDTRKALDEIVSTKPLGVTLDKENQFTTYRIFAPRATRVHLCFFDTPNFEVLQPKYQRIDPAARYAMCRNGSDGTWALTTVGIDAGKYYVFTVDGPQGDGENFNGDVYLGDPYASAAAHAENCSIVMDCDATNAWFGGWTDQNWKAPKHEDMVIYEAHVRDLTSDPSSGVPVNLRGKYEGLLATSASKTGLDHIRSLGANMIEFLPTSEFGNGETNHNWGYCTAYYFAPEASYARDPMHGSQVFEFKRLVNELHRQGFGVIMDVVYNHVGFPNVFTMIDKKYYFRLNADYSFQNFSGCGNDVRSEAPMMRRLIIDNMVHWAREFHVDGFRLDLAELIDLETLKQARAAVLKVNPDAIVISEPWSFRGDHKQQLRGTGWAAWNNDFRYSIKSFVRGGADRNWMKKVIAGSTEIWTANPLQAINYAESHDDMSLVDELSGRPDHDGRNVTEVEARMNRLCAAVLFTSFGIPMITEGQEFLRSKRGIHNSFDRGDEVNALFWNDRSKPLPAQNQKFYADLIKLRRSTEAASLRLPEIPPGYLQWIELQDARLVGYIANASHQRPGRAFVVLYNAANFDADFSVPLPAGNWKQICDGLMINPVGTASFTGGQNATIRVPFGTAAILEDGF
jgi:pullulanase/glycogen debranching enzyme